MKTLLLYSIYFQKIKIIHLMLNVQDFSFIMSLILFIIINIS